MPGFFGNLLTQAATGAAAYTGGQMAGQEKRASDDAARRKEILEHAILTLKTEQEDQAATDAHRRAEDEHSTAVSGKWDKVDGGDGLWHYVNRDTGEDRPTTVPTPASTKPVKPNGWTVQGHDYDTEPDALRAAGQFSSTTRAPKDPTASDDAKQRRSINDYALLLAREGSGETPGSPPRIGDMQEIMKAQFPDADEIEIASAASNALQVANTERHTRVGDPTGGTSADDIRSQLGALTGGASAPPIGKPARPSLGPATANAAPAPSDTDPVAKRARALQATGMSHDDIIATLKREHLIQQ